MGKTLRVLLVDDSPTVRHFLAGLINAAPDMQVVGEGRDGEEAIALVERLKPDILSMDVQMPRLDGLAATHKLMVENPLPIVIVSGRLQRKDVDLAFLALQAGALAVLETPPHHGDPEFIARRDQFLHTLRTMSAVRVVRRWGHTPAPPVITETTPKPATQPLVVAIGASAGGPVALHHILGELPADFNVPLVIVQHMADGFMDGMIRWLDSCTSLPVMQARQAQIVQPGEIVVAGCETHLLLRKAGDRVRVMLDPERGAALYQPSVDLMFESVARSFGTRALGILLTGMGEDGAVGLKAMHGQGARTIAQDEESCLVYGMPGAAVALGAAEQIVPLNQIASTILDLVQVPSDG